MVCFLHVANMCSLQAELKTNDKNKRVDVEERGHSQPSMRGSLRKVESPYHSSMFCLGLKIFRELQRAKPVNRGDSEELVAPKDLALFLDEKDRHG